MKKSLFHLLLLTTLVTALLASLHKTAPAANSGADKIDAWVLQSAAGGETEFLVALPQQADLSGARFLKTKAEKGGYVVQHLKETARRTQEPLLRYLDSQGAEYRPYWVANLIWVRGYASLVWQLAHRMDVAHIYANPQVYNPEPVSSWQSKGPEAAGPTWNIELVHAPTVWDVGFTGQGAVVAGQDTGYQWDHPALKNAYRGWDGIAADHNYNWHDAIHENNSHTGAGNPCGFDAAAPCDDHGHGTHTMGIMIGDDGASNQIGMAPGARWIGCRNMEEGWGKPSTYIECFQFFIAPTDLNDENAMPSLAPDVINNSWSCPTTEGCTDPNALLTVVENVRAAGILTVQSAGNSGPTCHTISEPAAIYDASFTVGSTEKGDGIAAYSSRGTVTVDGSDRPKPDISAPGSDIHSSFNDGGYRIMSGTSMAGPHVAGLAALLISADPTLAGDVDRLETLIEESSKHISNTQCGGDPSGIPNNVYGWGRIDAFRAFLATRYVWYFPVIGITPKE